MGLSNRRWMSVRDYVVKKGVDGGRVSGQGFGESKPIADNKTAEGRCQEPPGRNQSELVCST